MPETVSDSIPAAPESRGSRVDVRGSSSELCGTAFNAVLADLSFAFVGNYRAPGSLSLGQLAQYGMASNALRPARPVHLGPVISDQFLKHPNCSGSTPQLPATGSVRTRPIASHAISKDRSSACTVHGAKTKADIRSNPSGAPKIDHPAAARHMRFDIRTDLGSVHCTVANGRTFLRIDRCPR
jgi:hypothetical protein